jgi:Fuseless
MSTEHELREEIARLQKKLEHAQSWMTRQVEESRVQRITLLSKTFLFWEKIVFFAQKAKKFNLFRKKYTVMDLWKKRFEAFVAGAAIILFWRGIWNLADLYLFPQYETLSAFISLLIGAGLMIMMKNFVNQFLDEAVEEAGEYE